MVVACPRTHRMRAHLWHRRIVVTREGDTVFLSWKQVALLLFGAVAPAITFGAALAHWAGRVQVAETVLSNHAARIESTERRVSAIERRDGTLQRLEQHLIDIDRQLMEIKEQSRGK